MKKIFLLSIILIFMTGCTSIKNDNLDNIIDKALNSNLITRNTNRVGYRYYLPRGLSIKYSDNYNEVFTSDKYTFYLYVDIVSYNKNVKFTYNENKNAYYSKLIEINGRNGYIEINNYKNNQYLIEIMYNYAKIEVMVDDDEINKTLLTAITLLKSIKYNATIIEKLVNDDNLDYTEEKFDMFVESINNSDVLQHIDDDNESNNTNEDIIDTDFLN